MEASIQPITRTVLRVSLNIHPDFSWNDQVEMETPKSILVEALKCLCCMPR